MIDLVFVVFRNGSRHLLFFRRHPFDVVAWWATRREAAKLFDVETVYVETIDLESALDEEIA